MARTHRKATPEEARKIAAAQADVKARLPELKAEGRRRKREADLLIHAVQLLRRERNARGLSLAEVAERSGIDKSRLSKLENDPFPNPTIQTLIRIAEAIGVRLDVSVESAA